MATPRARLIADAAAATAAPPDHRSDRHQHALDLLRIDARLRDDLDVHQVGDLGDRALGFEREADASLSQLVGYLFFAGIRGGSPHRRTERPPFEVSVKAGTAQPVDER
jgi:hypothetical protein